MYGVEEPETYSTKTQHKKPNDDGSTVQLLPSLFNLKALWTAGFASGVGGGLGWQVAIRLNMLKGLGRLALATGPAAEAFSVTWDWHDSTNWSFVP